MASSSALSAAQIEHFKTRGYLVLKNFFDTSDLDIWREQIWRALDSSLETPETWPSERGGLDGYEYNPPESTFGLHPKLTGIVDQLGGGDFVLGDGIPIIRWPEPGNPWEMPKSGHIDAYGGRWLPFMFGATMYLYDVDPGGGALIVWSGSHHAAHRYFMEHPSQVDGSFLKEDGFTWDVFCDNPATGGEEFVAKAGDVVLWHSYLTHNGSANVNDSPRIALFTRYDHRRRQETAFRHEIPEDLWKYWAI